MSVSFPPRAGKNRASALFVVTLSFSGRWFLWREARRRRVACCQLRSLIGDEDNEHSSRLTYARIFTDEMFTAGRRFAPAPG